MSEITITGRINRLRHLNADKPSPNGHTAYAHCYIGRTSCYMWPEEWHNVFRHCEDLVNGTVVSLKVLTCPQFKSVIAIGFAKVGTS